MHLHELAMSRHLVFPCRHDKAEEAVLHQSNSVYAPHQQKQVVADKLTDITKTVLLFTYIFEMDGKQKREKRKQLKESMIYR